VVMKRMLAIAAAAFSAVSAAAQTITGTVRGAGAPIVGAAVRLLELDRAVRTGAQGQFTFSRVPTGTYTLFASGPGYASATDSVRVTGDQVAARLKAEKQLRTPARFVRINAVGHERSREDLA